LGCWGGGGGGGGGVGAKSGKGRNAKPAYSINVVKVRVRARLRVRWTAFLKGGYLAGWGISFYGGQHECWVRGGLLRLILGKKG